METILEKLRSHGCTISPLTKTMPGAAIVGLAGRDVICFMTPRTKVMQKFADAWRGAPPVDLLNPSQATELVERILAGEFDDDSRVEAETIIFRMRNQ